MTTLASTLAYAYVHFMDEGSFLPTEIKGWVAILIFAPIAILANAVAGQARLRTAEAIQRRNEAEANRDEIRVLADQQAALHRVATLVARAVAPSEVFSAVTRELADCLGVPHATLCRYEPDGSSTLVAIHDENARAILPVGTRLSFEGENVVAMVFRTGRVVRMDSHKDAAGSAAEYIRALGFDSGVGVPIVVAGRLWGAAVVGCSRPLPPDTEARVGDFADLVATAIANADARSELTASRARIVAAGDDVRRRFERNLHDGAQQRLVSLGLQLRTAEAGVPPECPALAEQISDAVAGLTDISDELQEISRGMHPAVLSRGGLGPAIKMLARRSTVPVELELAVGSTTARIRRGCRVLRTRRSPYKRGQTRAGHRRAGELWSRWCEPVLEDSRRRGRRRRPNPRVGTDWAQRPRRRRRRTTGDRQYRRLRHVAVRGNPVRRLTPDANSRGADTQEPLYIAAQRFSIAHRAERSRANGRRGRRRGRRRIRRRESRSRRSHRSGSRRPHRVGNPSARGCR